MQADLHENGPFQGPGPPCTRMQEASPGLGPAACLSWSDAEKVGLLSDERGHRPAGRSGKPAPISLQSFARVPACSRRRKAEPGCVWGLGSSPWSGAGGHHSHGLFQELYSQPLESAGGTGDGLAGLAKVLGPRTESAACPSIRHRLSIILGTHWVFRGSRHLPEVTEDIPGPTPELVQLQ